MKLALTYLSDFTASVLLTLIEDSCSRHKRTFRIESCSSIIGAYHGKYSLCVC